MQSPYILVEDYTEVFYMTHKGDVPSDECEMNHRWSKSIREGDGQSFILIGFNVPALAPCLNLIQTALQLCENKTLFAIRGIHSSAIGKEGQINTWCLGRIIYIHTVQC
jgi:hypothetical protein